MTNNKSPPEFAEARKYVIRNAGALRSQYGNDFISVYAGEGVISRSTDRAKLASDIANNTNLRKNVLITSIDEVVDSEFIKVFAEIISGAGAVMTSIDVSEVSLTRSRNGRISAIVGRIR